MTTQLKWRLGKLPTPEEVTILLNQKIITKEEAREILFNEVDESKRDEESLKEEIKFLKELVSKLSSRYQIVENIRYISPTYSNYPWYGPYMTYCASGANTLTTTGYTTSGTALVNCGVTTSTGTANNLVCSSASGAGGMTLNLEDCQTDCVDGSDFASIKSI